MNNDSFDCGDAATFTIPTDSSIHYVYVAWHRLQPAKALYVGVSSNLMGRLGYHRTYADWWKYVGRVEAHGHPSRVLADRCEAASIARLQPLYNHNPGGTATVGFWLKRVDGGPASRPFLVQMHDMFLRLRQAGWPELPG